MPSVKFLKEKKTVEVPEGANLRKEALKNGVPVYTGLDKLLHCPGLGMCTTCKVHIKKGAEHCNRPSWWERANIVKTFLLYPFTYFARIGHENELRLSCQTKVYGDIEVETTPEFNWHGERFWG